MSELTIRLYEDSQDNIESLYYQSASKIDRLKAELSEAYTELAISIKERIDLGNQLAEANNDLIKHGELCHAAGRGFARDTIKDLERQLDAEAAIRKEIGE